MNTGILPGVIAVVLVSIATLAIGTFGLRISRTTSDFLVASRTVRPISARYMHRKEIDKWVEEKYRS